MNGCHPCRCAQVRAWSSRSPSRRSSWQVTTSAPPAPSSKNCWHVAQHDPLKVTAPVVPRLAPRLPR
eukprot:8126796-Pyramimonas_sp.AAC.1